MNNSPSNVPWRDQLIECESCGEEKPRSEMGRKLISKASWGYHGGCPAEYADICLECIEREEEYYGD
jgi:hypothetical protein